MIHLITIQSSFFSVKQYQISPCTVHWNAMGNRSFRRGTRNERASAALESPMNMYTSFQFCIKLSGIAFSTHSPPLRCLFVFVFATPAVCALMLSTAREEIPLFAAFLLLNFYMHFRFPASIICLGLTPFTCTLLHSVTKGRQFGLKIEKKNNDIR